MGLFHRTLGLTLPGDFCSSLKCLQPLSCHAGEDSGCLFCITKEKPPCNGPQGSLLKEKKIKIPTVFIAIEGMERISKDFFFVFAEHSRWRVQLRLSGINIFARSWTPARIIVLSLSVTKAE